jgi:alpha-methylacyl-CoA racemase
MASGPLSGVRIIEMAGLGPGPYGGMLLSDMGAEVLRVDRPDLRRGATPSSGKDVLARGRRSIVIDLKSPDGIEVLLRLVEEADAMIEPFRAGVAERLGFGPEVCLARNPRLVYGRMTGWGQTGPYAKAAGHDLNYIALSGALEPMGRAGQKPTPPLNLVGDFGGGGMMLAFGVACALYEAKVSGQGQVVDAAMVDGAASLMAGWYALYHVGRWQGPRGGNLIDTGAWFYEVYETKDHKYVSVGAIEPQFLEELCDAIGLEREAMVDQLDETRWPALKERMVEIFLTKTRDEWCSLLEYTDACFAPVLTPLEAPTHPHNVERGTFVEIDGMVQPGPAPRFSRTPGAVQGASVPPGQDTEAVLSEWLGVGEDELGKLRDSGAVR